MTITLSKWRLHFWTGFSCRNFYLHFAESQCFTENHSGNFGSVNSTNHLTSYDFTFFRILSDALLYTSPTFVRKNNTTTWEFADSSKRSIDFPLVSAVPLTNCSLIISFFSLCFPQLFTFSYSHVQIIGVILGC